MSFKLIGGGSSLNTIVNDMNQNILELKNREVTEFFKDETGTRRVQLGKGADGFYGLKVSQDGTDVYTADDDELVFNSSQNVFKIVESGTLNLSQSSVSTPGAGNFATGQVTLATYTHNLGYKPAAMGFIEFTSGAQAPLPYTAYDVASVSNATWQTYHLAVTATTLTVRCRIMVYGGGWNTFNLPISIKYYLLQETAA